MRNRFKLGAVLVAVGLALAGCGDSGGSGNDAGGNSLTWWVMKGTNPDASAFYAAAKKEFKAETGATLKIEEVEWADAHDKLVRTFAGGGGPDVSEIGTTWTTEFAEAGGLADLTSKIEDAGIGDDLIQALKDSATLDGKIYGMGWYAGTRAVVYRKDIFDKHGLKEPTNWAELRDLVRTLKTKEPDMMPMPIAGASAYASAPFIWGAGGDFATDADGKWTGALDSAKAKEGLDFYTGLALKDKSSSAGAATWLETDLLDSFSKNKAVMVIQGNWTPKAAIEANPDLKGKVAAFAIPGKDGGLAPAFLGGSNLAVLKTSKNQDLAWKLVEMIATGDLGKKWADDTGFFPATNELLSTYAESSDPLVAPFATAMLEAGKNVPGSPAWGAVEGAKIIPQMLQAILTGKSIDEATKTASDAITKSLQGS